MAYCKRILFASYFLIICTVGVFSQSMLSGNAPFGLPLHPASGTSAAMGGTGIGIPNYSLVMLANPANLAIINRATFSSLLTNELISIKDPDNRSDFFSIQPIQVSLALPLNQYGTLGFSFSKRSTALLRYQQTGFIIDSVFTKTKWERSGGINMWEAGWGFPISSHFHFGLQYQRPYFTLTNMKLITIDSMLTYDSTKYAGSSNGFRLGGMATFKRWAAGFTGEYFTKTNTTMSRGTFNNNGSTPVNPLALNKVTTSIQIPPSIGIGLSFNQSNKFLIGTDFSGVIWKLYKDNSQDISATNKDKLRDMALSWSLGMEYVPAPNLLLPKYWEILRYRSGICFTQLPTQKEYEETLSLGIGFPLNPNGMIDLGMELGERASKQYSGYSERFFKFSIGFNGSKKWNRVSTFAD